MKQDDSENHGTTAANVTYGDPPCTADPLGVAVVLYAAGPLPGTYAYAGPFEPPSEPWQPTSPFSPTEVVITNPCSHTAEFKRIEEHLARIVALLEQVLVGLKVREACNEMLDKLGVTKTP